MIKADQRRQQDYHKNTIIKEAGGDNATVDSVLNHLLDDDSDYVVRKWVDEEDERTVVERIMFCIMWPFLLLTLPFRWVLTGKVGYDSRTKFGRFIFKITGTKY